MITDELKKLPKKNLILIGAVIGVIVIVGVIVSTMIKPPPLPEEIEEPELVYEAEVGNVKFTLKEVKDKGDVLKISESKYPKTTKEDLVTTERFIEVTIGVENIGKDNVRSGEWQIRNLTDAEGRIFYSSRQLENWVSDDSNCSGILKPGFAPVFCTKLYEVARIASGLKVEVASKQGGGSAFIDLGI